MFSKNSSKMLMVLILSGFASSSFAAWKVNKGTTTCRGDTCHHTTVKKGCVNGKCGTVKKSSTWHR